MQVIERTQNALARDFGACAIASTGYEERLIRRSSSVVEARECSRADGSRRGLGARRSPRGRRQRLPVSERPSVDGQRMVVGVREGRRSSVDGGRGSRGPSHRQGSVF